MTLKIIAEWYLGSTDGWDLSLQVDDEIPLHLPSVIAFKRVIEGLMAVEK